MRFAVALMLLPVLPFAPMTAPAFAGMTKKREPQPVVNGHRCPLISAPQRSCRGSP